MRFPIAFFVANAVLLRTISAVHLPQTEHLGLGPLKLKLAYSPPTIIYVNTNFALHHCAPCWCDADAYQTVKFSFQNPSNPSFSPNKNLARFQVFRSTNGKPKYNAGANVVNFRQNSDGSFNYTTETTIKFDSSMFPQGSQICVAVSSADPGSFSFLIQFGNDKISNDVWRVSDSDSMMPDLKSKTPISMRQFVQLTTNSLGVRNAGTILFDTKFCPRPKSFWSVSIQIFASTSLSAFETWACDISKDCYHQNYANWVAKDVSGTSYNRVVVNSSTPKLSGPYIRWAVYGIGANLNNFNNFDLCIEFRES